MLPDCPSKRLFKCLCLLLMRISAREPDNVLLVAVACVDNSGANAAVKTMCTAHDRALNP